MAVDSGEQTIIAEDPFARAQRFLNGLADHQLSTIDHQLLQRLRRFLFEQRSRVLQRLSGPVQPSDSTSTNAVSWLDRVFDLPKENEELARLLPLLTTASREGLNHTVRTGLLEALRTGPNENADTLAAQVKMFYNHSTERLLSQATVETCVDPSATTSNPQSTPAP